MNNIEKSLLAKLQSLREEMFDYLGICHNRSYASVKCALEQVNEAMEYISELEKEEEECE